MSHHLRGRHWSLQSGKDSGTVHRLTEDDKRFSNRRTDKEEKQGGREFHFSVTIHWDQLKGERLPVEYVIQVDLCVNRV